MIASMNSQDTFSWKNAYSSERQPVFARNMVATSHPLAAQAGLRMLAAGGNAVDAAVATAACMTIVEPCSNGLGSDAFCILWDGRRLHGLNASGSAPAAWTREHFGERKEMPVRGWGSVTVPGAVSAWAALAARFGTLPFADLLAPAAEIAERGYAVPVVVQQKWTQAAAVAELVSQPGFAQTFLPQGRVPRVGERFAMPQAAKALKLIGQTKGEAFYRGEIGAALAAHAKAHGGAMTEADLAAYQPEWVQPLAQDYRGHTLHEIPPNGQGVAAQMALGMLAHFDLSSTAIDGAACQHLQIEAMKLAFADVYRFVADAGHMEGPVSRLLEPDYLAARAKLIDPMRAQRFGPGHGVKGGTIYLSAADESGMMVSFIQSNYMGFGSGVVEPTFGVSLHNRGAAFALDPRHPNALAPGKRPFHTIIPGFLTKDGAPLMAFGVMGGNMQPQGHVQTLVRMLDHHQNPQTACDAPRWRFTEGLDINVERHMPATTIEGLQSLGHRIVGLDDSYMDFGAGQFIWRLGDPAVEGYVGASDARRDGAAVGF
jgi:gamma-glutamyltranspeptidase/glutathione hydrolase